MNVQHAFLCVLWALAGAGLAAYCATKARQITYVTLADGRKQERNLPMLFRILLPLTPNVRRIAEAQSFSNKRRILTSHLESAGFDRLVTATELVSLKILLPVILGAVWSALIVLMTASLHARLLMRLEVPLCLAGIVWFYVYPEYWLNKAVKQRHASIRRSLPFVLDLLTLSVEAGMDFMTALQRTIRSAELDPLSEELLRVTREIQVGKTRRQALRDMALRVGLADLRVAVHALVQADELGVSIAPILRIQADQVRQRRFERAEKAAHEAPVKLLAPLVLFIFPSVFLILLGPVVLRLIQQGF